MASAGPYARLHLAPDRLPPLGFLQAGCPSCRPTNSIKALKAEHTTVAQEKNFKTLASCMLFTAVNHRNHTLRTSIAYYKKHKLCMT